MNVNKVQEEQKVLDLGSKWGWRRTGGMKLLTERNSKTRTSPGKNWDAV
jgi:hypothetical protein